MLAYLHHAVDQCLIVLVLSVSAVGSRATRHQVLLPLSVLLRDEAHRELAYVDGVIWIVLTGARRSSHGSCLILIYKIEVDIVDHCLLLAHMTRPRCLYRPKPAATHLVVH